MKKLLTFINILAITLLNSSCYNQIKKNDYKVNFAIIGNTSPESPYKAYPERLFSLKKTLNLKNPTFVLHTGNIINAGNDNIGLKDYDIENQFLNFYKIFGSLRPIMYNCVGEKDTYMNNYHFYEKHTKNPPYYSFNYGNTHFIVLNSNDTAEQNISQNQITWLEKDLDRHKYVSAIIVITYNPIFSLKNKKSQIKLCKQGRELHRIFLHYPVRLVISGYKNNFYQMNNDNITYINAGTAEITNRARYYEFNYYLIDLSNENITINGYRL